MVRLGGSEESPVHEVSSPVPRGMDFILELVLNEGLIPPGPSFQSLLSPQGLASSQLLPAL